jgi:hypothetical protein
MTPLIQEALSGVLRTVTRSASERDALHWLAFRVSEALAPMERVVGFSPLGANTVSRFSGNVQSGGGMRGFFGGN